MSNPIGYLPKETLQSAEISTTIVRYLSPATHEASGSSVTLVNNFYAGGKMKNPFPFSLDNKRYYTLNYFYKTKFGKKVYKVPLTLGHTCPNRDGSKGNHGCLFCLGGGGTPFSRETLQEQFLENSVPLERKWPHSLKIAYFQSYTNTYLAASTLQSALERALTFPHVVGIAVATRGDCLGDDIVSVLHSISRKTFLTVELGLQTTNNSTADFIGRGHSYEDFLWGYKKLNALDIPVSIHLINGLPNENSEIMLKTARDISLLKPHSVKFHMLHVLEGTKLGSLYKNQPFHLLSQEEYVEIVGRQIELLPPTTVVERITGDPPQDCLIAPLWTENKLLVRNRLDQWFASRNSWQGIHYLEIK